MRKLECCFNWFEGDYLKSFRNTQMNEEMVTELASFAMGDKSGSLHSTEAT